jgi:murein DD-endopeptidase MepM/ murein hydrolase activator NlpD
MLATAALPASAADSPEDIRAKIADNNQKIADLQKQIDQYSTLLNSTSQQAQTLSNALKSLELTQKKLETNLALTTQKISKTALTIKELDQDIDDTEARIAATSKAISASIRDTALTESQSPIENFLNNKSISATWDYMNAVQSLRTKVKDRYDELHELSETLASKQDEAAGEKSKLESYQKSLVGEQATVAATKDQKSKLLVETSGKEAEYKKILADKIEEREAYEKELFSYESQLKLTLKPGEVPTAKTGVLSWPLDSIRITQLFGKTVSAKRLYVSGTHGGIDLAASIGTPVKAALSGTVSDTEPTKYKSGCQYGKFVLIKHPNGLSTIYGHLSVVSVKPGDTVITGDTIGYSGDTGYATGPHLHFGVYVTEGIRIVDSAALNSKTCAGIKTVAAPTNAYLDPMAYLPKL